MAPAGIVATGWPRVKNTCRNIGWGFDPWQDATGRLILAKSATGRWAADLSILSIPRQVGKSYLLGCIIFALCLLNPKLRVIWTSHHTATTEEMYEAMKELAAHKRVAPHIVKCIALQGSRWRIQFRNGSRIDFGARSQGFGRGKAKVGVLVLDEFQHITGRALANLAPTTNTADNPLILCAGTPPGPEVSGEAFRQRRTAALDGLSDDTLYVEFSADEDADPDDRKQWAKANPSFPKRTKERAFLLLKKILDPDDFLREALGIWDKDGAGVLPGWGSCLLDVDNLPPVTAIGISVSIGSMYASIASADLWDDGRVNLSAVDRRQGTAWLVGEAKRIQSERGCAVALDEKCADGTLVKALQDANVDVTVLKLPDVIEAHSELVNRVRDQRVTHQGAAELDEAVQVADWRSVGDGRQVFGRTRSSGPIDMLEAAAAAMQAALRPVGSGIYIY